MKYILEVVFLSGLFSEIIFVVYIRKDMYDYIIEFLLVLNYVLEILFLIYFFEVIVFKSFINFRIFM